MSSANATTGHTCQMRARKPLALVVATLALFATACSSSTVIDASAAGALDEDRADAPAALDSSSADQADEPDEASAAPTSTPQPPADAEDEPDVDRTLEVDAEEQWESLAVLCRADDARACDVLFLISPVDSDFELLGSTCGGGGIPESGWCTDGVETGLDGLSFDESSPGIDAVAADCSNGDMMACDFLYFGSPGGGQWEAFGDGCGGRTTSAFPDCRTEFPDN